MSAISLKNIKLGDNADPSKNFVISVPSVADGTLTIKRENGTNVLSIAANGEAVIPGVVGTVAQVGGIPTGQVVERRSNANGAYVRFADGTQICTHILNVGPWTANASASAVWSYPAAFSAIPVTAANGNTTSPHSFNASATSNLSTASVYYGGSIAATGAVEVCAIGRWF